MSALPPKADIGTQSRDVRFVPKADIGNDLAAALQIDQTGDDTMRRRFAQEALLATLLLVGSLAFVLGDEAPSVDPRSSDSVKAFALQWFGHLQAGQIDRTQMTTALSDNLTDNAVKEMARYLKSYGPAARDEIVETRKIQDQTFYVVKLLLQRGDALTLLIGFDDKGKVTGITFPSMGRE
jgi:hypothetical protein